MRKQMWFKVCAVVLAVALCAAPFIMTRFANYRLPENPIPSEPETVTQTEKQTAAEAPDQPDRADEAQKQEVSSFASPDTDIAQTTTRKNGEQPVIGVTRPDEAPITSAYGFSQSGGITAGRTAVGTTKPAPENSRPEPSAAQTTLPSPAPAGGSTPSGPSTVLPTSTPSQAEEEEPSQPDLDTDLAAYRTVNQSQLTENALTFYVRGIGAKDLTVQVHIKQADTSAAPTRLSGTDGVHYTVPLERGETYQFTASLYQAGHFIKSEAYLVTYEARSDDVVDDVEGRIVLKTSLDDLTDDSVMQASELPLHVEAYYLPDRQPIYADHIRVELIAYDNGLPSSVQQIRAVTGTEYMLGFRPPNNGDTRTYAINITVWHPNAQTVTWSRRIIYQNVAAGTKIGTVRVTLDATTLGLCDVVGDTVYYIEQADMPLKKGEEIAALIVMRFLEEHGFTYEGELNPHSSFYLRSISRAGLCDGIQIPENLLLLLGEDGFVFDRSQFTPDTLGAKDFTGQSGWTFTVNDVYWGQSMSAVPLKDGDVLSLRFTLAYGKDVGAATVNEGNLKSYCGVWADGVYTPRHVRTGDPIRTENGDTAYRCANCGQIFIPETEDEHEVPAKKSMYRLGTLSAAQRLYARRVR